jgi:hypothetical protein
VDLPHGIALGLFAACTFGVVALGVKNAAAPESASQFFHTADSAQNTIGLFVATVTVASGVGYLLAGGQINGVAMLAVPLAMLLGFRLLADFYGRVVSKRFAAYPSFWAGAQVAISEATGRKSIVGLVLTTPLAVIFLLFCAFELLVSAQIIAAILFRSPSLSEQGMVATAMFVGPLILALRSGVRGIFKADTFQFIGVAVLALVFVVGAMSPNRLGEPLAVSPSIGEVVSTPRLGVTVVLAILASILTQFYSTINHHTAANVAGDNAAFRRVVIRAGLMMVAFFSTMVLIGVYSGIEWSKGLPPGVDALLARLPGGNVTAVVLGAVVVGLWCITVTTLQSLMLGVTLQLYSGVLGRDSKDVTSSPNEVAYIRRLLGATFALVVALSAGAFYTDPSVFYTLLAIASGAEALVPLILLIGFLSRRENAVAVLSNAALVFYPIFFASAIISNLTLAKVNPTLVPYVSLAHFSASAVYSLMLAHLAKRRGGSLGRASDRESAQAS